MINDKASVTGQLQIILTDEHGNVKLNQTVHNLVVTGGKNIIAGRLGGNSTTGVSVMKVGTSNIAPVSGDTSLVTSVGSVTTSGVTVVGPVVTYSATFGPGVGDGALQEAGLFNTDATPLMLARTTFNIVNKSSSDSLTINWAITIN